jgi:hypothetical protein
MPTYVTCARLLIRRLSYEFDADFSKDYLYTAKRISDGYAALVIILYHYVKFLVFFCIVGEYSTPIPQQAGDDQHQERDYPCGTTRQQGRYEALNC